MIKRRDMVSKIVDYDQKLSKSRSRFTQSFRKNYTQFKNQPPVVLVTGGVAAGFIMQAIGWRPMYSTLILAFKLLPFLSSQPPLTQEV